MKEWTMAAVTESIPILTEAIDAELEALDCPMKAQTQIDVVIDEVFSNIARYAYAKGVGEAIVALAFDAPARRLTLTFTDAGMAYNPLEKPDPDIDLPVEDREIGGLGIFLVKRMMDDVRYRREGDRNILTLVKQL